MGIQASKKEARRRALLLEAELIEGRYQSHSKPPKPDTVIEEYLRFLRTERRAKKTFVKYEKVFGRLRELLEHRHVSSLSGLNLKALDAYRHTRVAAGAAPKTVYNESVIIRQLVNFAISRGLIASDPLKGSKIQEPKPTAQPCFTPTELEQILAASPIPQRWAYTLLADTGMRISELCYLTWDDVDYERHLLHVRPKDDWRPKTGDQRAIPMSPRVRALLQQLPRRSRWVITSQPSARYPRGDHQASERRLLVGLKRILKKLGLRGHLHTFRHAFISHSLTTGIPEAIVREWVGHVDRDVMRLYTHIASASSQAAMKRFAGSTAGSAEARDAGGKGRGIRQEAESAHFQHTSQEEINDPNAK